MEKTQKSCGNLKNRLIIVAVLTLIFGGIYSYSSNASEDCINLYVDYGYLDSGSRVSKCLEASGNTAAGDILRDGNIAIEGTDKYGLLVVCRVNGLPTKETESCEVMPSEKAYWAIIIKEKFSAINLFPKWGWAQVGVADLKLNPGDSLGLVFVKDGELKWPD